MTPLEKKEGEKNDRRTRAQLQEALAKAHNLIDAQKKELNTFKKALEKSKAELATWEEHSKEFELKKTKIEQHLHKAEKHQRALEQTKREQKKKITRLQKELETTRQSDESTFEDISAGRATFRIDLYPREGHFHGKIIYPLTKDDRTLKGLDMSAIEDFISKHLPQLEEQVTQPQPAVAQQNESSFPAAPTTFHAKTPRMREFNLFSDYAPSPSNIIKHNQPFQVQLIFDPTNAIKEQGAPIDYHASLYAKRLEGGFRKITGEVRGNIESADLFTTMLASAPLPTGTYRLKAFVTFKPIDGEPPEVPAFRESSLIHVH